MNLTGYDYVNVEFYSSVVSTNSVYMAVCSSLGSLITEGTAPKTSNVQSTDAGTQVRSLNISAINATCLVNFIVISVFPCYVYRIWLS